MEKNYKLPAIVWLRVTDYMHVWLMNELGGELRIKDQRVVCVQHLSGARDILRMETMEETTAPKQVGSSISGTLKNCIDAGMELDPDTITEMYGVTREEVKLYIPIECPKMCLTKSGTLRPWTLQVNFGQKQATALQKLLRQEFWNAVEEYDKKYAEKMEGQQYYAIDMIEDFCLDTKTPDLYVEAMRREWQRRSKRSKEKGEE